MSKETAVVTPRAGLSREAINTARVMLLDELDRARTHLDEASLNAALPGGDDKAMVKAEEAVQRIQQKLAGLKHGLKQVEAEEREKATAEKLVRRREAAVQILSLIHQRYWATVELDKALARVGREIERVDALKQSLLLETAVWFSSGDRREEGKLRNFLMNIDATDMTDTGYRIRKDIGRLDSYSKNLPLSRPAALRALASMIPEVTDSEVEQEAVEAAQHEFSSDG